MNSMPLKDPCLSESFIRNGNSGVLSYLGSSREGWGSIISNSLGSSLLYEAEYYNKLFNPDEKYKNFAKLVFEAKSARISASEWNSSQRWLQFALNAIGDAEMYIYTDTPKEFDKINASYDEYKKILTITSQDYFDVTIYTTDEKNNLYYSTIKNTTSAEFSNIKNNTTMCFTYPGYIPNIKTLSFYRGMPSITEPSHSLLSEGLDAYSFNQQSLQNISMHATPGIQFIDIIIDADNNNDNTPIMIIRRILYKCMM